jgi:hypothetical protein
MGHSSHRPSLSELLDLFHLLVTSGVRGTPFTLPTNCTILLSSMVKRQLISVMFENPNALLN